MSEPVRCTSDVAIEAWPVTQTNYRQVARWCGGTAWEYKDGTGVVTLPDAPGTRWNAYADDDVVVRVKLPGPAAVAYAVPRAYWAEHYRTLED